jgi:hypothetical protein
MPTKKRTRENRHTRTFGEKPRTGRRYVSDGKVRIEWYEEGKRRSRTIGENTPQVRRRADEALQEILEVFESAAATGRTALTVPPPETLDQAVRALAVSVLDVADQVAESIMDIGAELVHRIRTSRTGLEPQRSEPPEGGGTPEE